MRPYLWLFVLSLAGANGAWGLWAFWHFQPAETAAMVRDAARLMSWF